MKTWLEGLKSKRITGGTPTDFANLVSWFRTAACSDKLKRIYEEDPYVIVSQFRDNIYSLFTENCDFAGDVWMHLIVGPEKALLIDTGFGLGDLPALVERLAPGKELIVVNTHPHPDHAIGNCRFDRVYCHEYAVPVLEKQDEHLWDYLFDENGRCKWLEFDPSDLPAFKRYEIVPIQDGHVFHLGGGYEVEAKWVPGHDPAHLMLIDQTARILFAGDGLCAHISGEGSGIRPGSPYGRYNNLETYREELRKLWDRREEFNSIFPNHFMLDLPAEALLKATLDACDAILDEGKFDVVEQYKTGQGGSIERSYKFIKGFGMLGCTPQAGGLYKPKDEA